MGVQWECSVGVKQSTFMASVWETNSSETELGVQKERQQWRVQWENGDSAELECRARVQSGRAVGVQREYSESTSGRGTFIALPTPTVWIASVCDGGSGGENVITFCFSSASGTEHTTRAQTIVRPSAACSTHLPFCGGKCWGEAKGEAEGAGRWA